MMLITLTVLIGLLVLIQGGHAGRHEREASKENIEHIFEKSGPGQMVCIYSGSLCKRGEEYCSTKSETCEQLFSPNSTEQQKLDDCKVILLKKNESGHGKYDTCIYFRGMLERGRDVPFKHANENNHQDSYPVPELGKEFCPFANESCQRGNEICNSTSRKCEQVFPGGANEEQKRKQCQEVFSNNETAFWDACVYTLGILSSTTTTATDKELPGTNIWGITVTVVLVGVFVVAFIIFCWWKKWLCFKQCTKSEYKLTGQAYGKDKVGRVAVPMVPTGDNENYTNETGHAASDDQNRRNTELDSGGTTTSGDATEASITRQ